jgi:hypothetical protein
MTPSASIQVGEVGPQTFALSVTFAGEHFDCGVYLNRAEALKAGRLFVGRKEAEAAGRKKRPRRSK